MTLLTTHNLSKQFGGQDIFADLSLAIHHGDRIALVGPNGEGKTTLLRILVGLERSSNGQVHTAKGLKIGYLKQHTSLNLQASSLWELALAAFAEVRQQEADLRAMEAALAHQTESANHNQLLKKYGEAQARFELAGGYGYEQKIEQVLTGLGFEPETYHLPLAQFSGGEQSRAHLAQVLLEQPNLLLLDEPTNHLDLDSVEWLETYLQSWPGALVVVAHDRYFLDKVANQVWELALGEVETYRGNFSHYVVQRQERFEQRLKAYKAQQAQIAKEEEFIRRNIAGQNTRQAQGRRTRLERMERLAKPVEQQEISLSFQTTLRSGDLVLATHDLVVGYPQDEPLLYCPDLEIKRGHRIALLGPNGSGKTTLLKTVLGDLSPRAGRVRFGAGVKIGYFAQTHAHLNLKATILEEILATKNLAIGEARTYLGRFLFSGDDVFKRIEALSGGERSRVALAKLILTGANFLILDEPTNHLDIPSQETLENTLDQFAGTILMVSHDRYFVDAVASHTWALDPETKTVTVLPGGYSHYQAHRQTQRQAAQSTAAAETTEKSSAQRRREQTKAQQRAAAKKARQVAEIEQIIENTENKLARLTTQLEEASLAQDIERLQKLGQDYQHTEAKLEELITQWSEMEMA